MSIGISCIGTYVPPKIMTNNDLAQIVDTNDEWIYTRTGIRERHIADKEESTFNMAMKAVQDCLQKSKTDPKEIDFIICSTITHESRFPSVAALIQKELKIPSIPNFDMSPTCAGFIYLLATAESFIKAGFAKKVLCVSSEKLSTLTDWTDRNTCVLFGDAAAAVIVEDNLSFPQILKTIIGGEGEQSEALYSERQEDGSQFMRMDGAKVFKIAVRNMEEQVRLVCEKTNKSIDDIDLLIPHQANARIMQAVAERLGVPAEKTYMNIHRYGNTSSATIPLAISDALKEGILKPGMLVATPALGGGFTWGASLIQF